MTKDRTVQTFIELAKVSSPSYSEVNMVNALTDLINGYGWQCELIRQTVDMALIPEDTKARYTPEELTKKTEQLLVKIKGNDPSKAKIFFGAHIDTVAPGDNVKPQIVGDKIFSDGTTVLGSDDKSGVAAILIAVDEAIKSGEPRGDIALFFTALEEKGCLGAGQLDTSLFDLDYGFVFDTTESVGKMVVRTQHVQSLEVDIAVSNMPNHAMACTVENALGYASRMIAGLDRSLRDKEDMTFLQVVKLETSYDKGFLVPNKAKFKLTIRSFDKTQEQKMLAQAIEYIESFKDDNLTVSYVITPAKTQGYDNRTFDTGRLMLEKGASALRSIGIEPIYSADGLGSHDANKYIQKGIPSLVLSCGMQMIHTVNEWIYVKDLIDTTRLIRALIANA